MSRYNFCECESSVCPHNINKGRLNACVSTINLRDYHVAGIRQTLCPACAEHAQQFCRAEKYEFVEVK